MTNAVNTNRLHLQLADMAEVETRVSSTSGRYLVDVEGHEEAKALLEDLKTRAAQRAMALTERLDAIAGERLADRAPSEELSFRLSNPNQPATAALQEIFLLVSRAIVGYTKLQTLALRFRDSGALAPEGTASHLAAAYVQDSVQTIREINRILPDVLVWELDRMGSECSCTCPSCISGICLCPTASLTALREAGLVAEASGEPSIFVQRPRQGSPGEQAGLQRGDLLLKADGKAVIPLSDLQSTIRAHGPGETITLTVRSVSGGVEEVAMLRPAF